MKYPGDDLYLIQNTIVKDKSRSSILESPSSMPIGKRCFDIAMSSFIIITVLSWMIPLIGIFIKISSKGPIFFIQWRTGRYGKKFKCIKFRTMVHDKAATFRQATGDDPRITNIGRFLRKTNLDEMPQFLNVLLGDMSIVGPRPHAIEHDAQYWTIVPDFKTRYLVKPGITGISQTRGLRGEAGLKDMELRLKLDQWYIKKQSPILDVKICWWTVEKMIKGDEKAL